MTHPLCYAAMEHSLISRETGHGMQWGVAVAKREPIPAVGEKSRVGEVDEGAVEVAAGRHE